MTKQIIREIAEHTDISEDWGFADDACPVHGGKVKKVYTFGSSMTAETEVYVFCGCGCAIAERHDPIGIMRPTATYHKSYNSASGVGKLHAMEAAVKYR